MTYREILLANDETVKENAVDLEVAKASTDLSARIAKEKALLARLEQQKYHTIVGGNFNVDNIVETADMVAKQSARIEELVNVYEEFFPAE